MDALRAAFFVWIAQYHLLMVRHHLVALPLLATAFASGVDRCMRGSGEWGRRCLGVALAAGFAVNAWWGARAAIGIRRETPESILASFQRDIRRARAPFRLSPALAEALGPGLSAPRLRCGPARAPDATDAPDVPSRGRGRRRHGGPPHRLLVRRQELFWKGHVNNRLDGLAAFYGPMAANYDWNITFVGKFEHSRIVGVERWKAKAMELDMSGYVDCVPAR